LIDVFQTLPPTVPLSNAELDEKLDDEFSLRALPDYLPCRCHIDAGRTEIIVRAMRRDEVVDFYSAVKQVAASGNGYGIDELAGLDYFIRW